MLSSPTIYRSGSRTVEVLPGESHSAAWSYIARGGPLPESHPRDLVAGEVRRRVHHRGRRQPHQRRALTAVALTP